MTEKSFVWTVSHLRLTGIIALGSRHVPLVTFVIPTVGRKSLQRSVDSLYTQTDEDWEAIIIGDGVTPVFHTPEHDRRIVQGQLGKQKSAGAVRNAGLIHYQAMSGPSAEWIGFLDDDDRLAPSYVAHLREHAKDYPWADVIIFRMDHPELGILPPPHGELRQGLVGIHFAVKAEVIENFEFVDENVEELFHEDWEMISGLLTAGHRAYVSPYVDYLARA